MSTLADLYDPDAMPPDLRRAHSALDRAVDGLYRRSRFASERERVERISLRCTSSCRHRWRRKQRGSEGEGEEVLSWMI